MAATDAKLLTAALLAAAFSATPPALAQQAPLPPGGAESPTPVLGPPVAVPAPESYAPPPSPFPPPAAPGPFFPPSEAQNLWDRVDWPALRRRLFFDKEFDFLKPHLKAALSHTVTLSDGAQTLVQPPTAQVRWTEAPRLECGWFLLPDRSFLAVSWRGFADDGRQLAANPQGTLFDLRSRLDLNQIALDYGTVPYSYAPRWFVSGRIGMAAADVFFDNKAVNAVQSLYASNNYLGAGPHLRFDLWHDFNLLPEVSFFAQPDLMVLVGQIHQRFVQNYLLPQVSSVQGSFVQRTTQTVPVFTLRTGLSYKPSRWEHVRFLLGYEFEEWWGVGDAHGSSSRGQLSTNGVFVRLLANF